jgi:hypothetical protein
MESIIFPQGHNPGKMILFISKFLHLVHFMIQINYYRSNSVRTATSFKILNNVAVYILLDLFEL